MGQPADAVEVLPERKRLAEEQVGLAVEFLRDKMPEDFLLMSKVDGELRIMGGFSLNSAQEMLDYAIKAVAEQYAYKAATGKVGA